MTYKTASIGALLVAVLFSLTGCETLPVLPPPATPPPAAPAQQSAFRTKSGRLHSIVVTIPSDNPAANRHPSDYRSSFVLGYVNAWNGAVIDQRLKYRAYNGVFPSPAAEKNWKLYEGEDFDVEAVKLEVAAKEAPAKDVFALSDQNTARSTGRTDGERAAKAEFARLMLSREVR